MNQMYSSDLPFLGINLLAVAPPCGHLLKHLNNYIIPVKGIIIVQLSSSKKNFKIQTYLVQFEYSI